MVHNGPKWLKWSNMVLYVPKRSKMVQDYPRWTKMDQNGPNGPTWAKIIKMGHDGSKWYSKKRANMVPTDPNGPKWSKNVSNNFFSNASVQPSALVGIQSLPFAGFFWYAFVIQVERVRQMMTKLMSPEEGGVENPDIGRQRGPTIVWPQQTGRLWCLSGNFNGIRNPNHSKMVLCTINQKFI